MKSDWPSRRVRSEFLDFFAGKSHRVLPSFSIVPANDPTLLFTAAGMAPFKAEFAGVAKPVSPRIATCQKCLRADDVERVGHTARHHTFFEMLGNFSFGDYFKDEAIAWAWELLTRGYGLPADRLWVSVHTTDDEAYKIWNSKIGIPTDKLFRLSDNFWGPVGASGPCGPDSEIYYDRGGDASCGKNDCRPGCENTRPNGDPCDRFLELWNLVFTMYHKDESGKLHDLPKKNIDTGAGLERLTMVLQNAASPFETDLFSDTIATINPRYKNSPPEVSLATRIIADHVRAICVALADGVTPSNEGRGYVLRKILRRAFLYRQNIPAAPTLDRVAECVIEKMKSVYPELLSQRDSIVQTIKRSEEEFEKVLLIQSNRLLEEIEISSQGAINPARKNKIEGATLFKYHDEKGLPFEFVKELLTAKGYEVDEAGFQAEMEKQRQRSRAASMFVNPQFDLVDKAIFSAGTEFVGRDQLETDATVSYVAKGPQKGLTWIFLDKTPFYAEGGGQVGDTGWIEFNKVRAEVLDTKKNEAGDILHLVRGTQFEIGNQVHAVINIERRNQIRKHHTATHLLHAALRKILGPHVQQAGSFVCNEYLRLDFSHPQAMTEDELLKIEALVNEKVCENLEVRTVPKKREEALKEGALAFFGEKYDDEVRVVEVNKFSKELCGGTHAASTGELGSFIILKESSIAKGTRRIEAKTGHAAIEYLEKLQRLRFLMADRLKVDLDEIPDQLNLILNDRDEKGKQISKLNQKLAKAKVGEIKEESIDNINVVLKSVSGNRSELRTMIDSLKQKLKSAIILLVGEQEGTLSLAAGVTSDLIDRGYSAIDIVKEACKSVGGSGGGRKDIAEAGGKDPEKINEAFRKVRTMIELHENELQQEDVQRINVHPKTDEV